MSPPIQNNAPYVIGMIETCRSEHPGQLLANPALVFGISDAEQFGASQCYLCPRVEPRVWNGT